MRGHKVIAGLLFLSGFAANVTAQTDHPYETQLMREPLLSTGGSCVIRNVMIHTAIKPAFSASGDRRARWGRSTPRPRRG
jgi:hypothetical protein